MKEYAEYRNVLESLLTHFGKGFVTVGEIADYDGCDPRTVRKRYRIAKGTKGMDVAVLAHRKCEIAH